eukprot:TRINITY_DN5174_c0_g1_i1.p1 TRINITY_DN5174_c0_g1~~TRINITY_DN5174_c0_g1_i1.p1  ORF type:complete len:283 (+),score=43.29 TRINITY_DN5174_c0_g1_i1:158-1006(+)
MSDNIETDHVVAKTDESDSSTLSRLATVAAQLQATVSGSLATMAQNLKQSVETMAAFNNMMETYLIKSLSITSERGKIVKEADKVNFTFRVCLRNIGSYSIPGATITVSHKSTLDTETANIIGQIDVPMILANSTSHHDFVTEAMGIVYGSSIVCEVSFPSPGSGTTLRNTSARRIGVLELAQLETVPMSSFQHKTSDYSHKTTMKMVDASKLRQVFSVHPIHGLSGLLFVIRLTGKYEQDMFGQLESAPIGESSALTVGFFVQSQAELPKDLLESIIFELN